MANKSIKMITTELEQKKPNRKILREVMLHFRLNATKASELIYSSPTTIRTYCSKSGADISNANLELLIFKAKELPNEPFSR